MRHSSPETSTPSSATAATRRCNLLQLRRGGLGRCLHPTPVKSKCFLPPILRSGGDASALVATTEKHRKLIAYKGAEVQEALAAVQSRFGLIGNLFHGSVPVRKDEKEYNYFSRDPKSVIVRGGGNRYCFGPCRRK